MAAFRPGDGDNLRTAGGKIVDTATRSTATDGSKGMDCNAEIPEVGECLKDFLEALPPSTATGKSRRGRPRRSCNGLPRGRIGR